MKNRFITSYPFIDFVRANYDIFNSNDYIEKINNERKQFLNDFPLESICSMSLDGYCQNQNKNTTKFSFITTLEFKTRSFQSSPTGSIDHRIFYKKGEDFKFNEKYSSYFPGSDIYERFDCFKKCIYEFIKNFDENNYDKNKYLPANMNAIKSKLLLLYRFDSGVYGFSSRDKAMMFANACGLDCDRSNDVIEILIKIKNYVDSIDEFKNLNRLIIAKLCWEYYLTFIDLKNIDDIDRNYENTINDKKVLFNGPIINDTDLKRVFRNPKNCLVALKNSNYTCEFNKEHNSFLKRGGNERYLECHHLVPYNVKTAFFFSSANLDDPANIVTLCSECHNIIHYGIENEAIKRLKVLFNLRKKKLKDIGIDISFKELLSLYKLKIEEEKNDTSVHEQNFRK